MKLIWLISLASARIHDLQFENDNRAIIDLSEWASFILTINLSIIQYTPIYYEIGTCRENSYLYFGLPYFTRILFQIGKTPIKVICLQRARSASCKCYQVSA